MYLEPAKTIEDWQAASNLLIDVMENLNRQNFALWNESQLTLDGLTRQYKGGELFLAKSQGKLEGVVFLQEQDSYFWPELTGKDSLFLHKLAIHPTNKGLNKGAELITLAEQEAIKRGLAWLRLDCDDRKPLHNFYQKSEFNLVDITRMGSSIVARYEKPIIPLSKSLRSI